MMTSRGVVYSTDTRCYVQKRSTQGRTKIKVIAPNGHVISVNREGSGSINYTFYDVNSNTRTYMAGFLEMKDGQTYFIPRKQEHVWMLYNWDREVAPSDHMPTETNIDVLIPQARERA